MLLNIHCSRENMLVFLLLSPDDGVVAAFIGGMIGLIQPLLLLDQAVLTVFAGKHYSKAWVTNVQQMKQV